MIVRRKRSTSEVNRDDFEAKAKKAYYSDRYTTAKKEATLTFQSYRNDPDKWGKRGFGVISVVNEVNNRMLSSPNDRKLTKSAVFDCVMEDAAGTTPKKLGRPSKIPSPLPLALAQHAVMLQVSGEGEATGASIKCLTAAVVAGTEWENKFSTEYVWRKSRRLHPEILMPHSAKNNEDRRVDWLSYNNIMKWTARAKEFLISIGMAKDEPGMIRKCTHQVCSKQLLPCFSHGRHAFHLILAILQTVFSQKYLSSTRMILTGSSPSTRRIIGSPR